MSGALAPVDLVGVGSSCRTGTGRDQGIVTSVNQDIAA